jgi:hypothetical protein
VFHVARIRREFASAARELRMRAGDGYVRAHRVRYIVQVRMMDRS